jgi:GT2 family glycosyltransferase
MDDKIKLGIVILVWNSGKVIGNCLGSIAGLKKFSPAVVIIDNGSTDSTPEILDKYVREYPGVFSVIRHRENLGTTVTRNQGIKKLLGQGTDYICVLDSDTEVSDEAFLRLTKEMQEHPEYGLIGPTLVTSGGVVQMSARAFPTALEKLYKAVPVKSVQKKGEALEVQEPPRPGMTSYPVDYLMSACWLLRPEVFSSAGLLDEKIFYAPEDAEYCIRVWKAGWQVAFCPNARIIHEWQRLSKKKLISRINWEHIKGLAHMFIKHRYLFSAKKLRNKSR